MDDNKAIIDITIDVSVIADGDCLNVSVIKHHPSDKFRKVFRRTYKRHETDEVETWISNIISVIK
jgi:hypothetical protein